MNKKLSFPLLLMNTILVVVQAAPPLQDATTSQCGDDLSVMDCIFKRNQVNVNKDTFTEGKTHELFEGDIVWTAKLNAQLAEMRMRAESGISTFDAIRNGAWPNGIVPYTFASDFRYGSVVRQAIEEYNEKTCIKFVPYTSQNARDAGGYVEFMHGGGCYSMIGRQRGKQQISLGNGCGYKGVAIHEMMHALGWFHEQSRSDRDSFITIHWNNINRAMWYNFQKYKSGQADTLNEPYDKASVMHYGNYAFSINGQKTIVSRSNPSETLGQRNGLSSVDVRQLKKYYKCGGTTVVKPTPTTNNCNDGYKFCSLLPNWCSNSWVKTNCKLTCRQCVKPAKVCKDDNSNCTYWKRQRYCNSRLYNDYMKKNCQRACGFCR